MLFALLSSSLPNHCWLLWAQVMRRGKEINQSGLTGYFCALWAWKILPLPHSHSQMINWLPASWKKKKSKQPEMNFWGPIRNSGRGFSQWSNLLLLPFTSNRPSTLLSNPYPTTFWVLSHLNSTRQLTTCPSSHIKKKKKSAERGGSRL